MSSLKDLTDLQLSVLQGLLNDLTYDVMSLHTQCGHLFPVGDTNKLYLTAQWARSARDSVKREVARREETHENVSG